MTNFIVDYLKQKNLSSIPISTFMELALYDERNGYYQQEKTKIGLEGDFITTSSISPFFAKVVCQWFYEQVVAEQFVPTFCEIGAGNGNFAYEFLTYWYEISDIPLTYIVVEKSQSHLKEIKKKIQPFNNIEFYRDINELRELNGVIFSNELFDAFAVDIVKYEQEQWLEANVTIGKNNELQLIYVPCKREELLSYFTTYDLRVKSSFIYEIPLQMIRVYKQLAEKLISGKIVTVDYGYFHDELEEPMRKDGTLRCYYNHQLLTNYLDNVGKCDLTTHIHWDTLRKVGEQNGLKTTELVNQRQFLLNNNILQFLKPTDGNPFSSEAKKNRQITQLIMDGSLSNAFHLLIQQK